ncbi:MAG: hypothetical protein VXZ34_02950, partial [Candidatus Thermoplasmatota archaeon]|nr:hypothetical protein [Candidatus Thermoplasmatota archaeon]
SIGHRLGRGPVVAYRDEVFDVLAVFHQVLPWPPIILMVSPKFGGNFCVDLVCSSTGPKGVSNIG